MNLEKSRVADRLGVSSSAESSSSAEVFGSKSCFLESLTEKGSCSRESVEVQNGLLSSRPKRVSFILPSGPTDTKAVQSIICVDLGSLVESPTVRRLINKDVISEEGSAPELGEGLSSDSEATKEGMVMATLAAEKEGGTPIDGARGELEECELYSSENSEFREELNQAMLEVEMRKTGEIAGDNSAIFRDEAAGVNSAIFRGVVAGAIQGKRQSCRSKIKGSSLHKMKTRNAKHREVEQRSIELVSGSVEAEVANTLTVGAAIGIDFSEVEEEVMAEITRREYEDLARCAANSVVCCCGFCGLVCLVFVAVVGLVACFVFFLCLFFFWLVVAVFVWCLVVCRAVCLGAAGGEPVLGLLAPLSVFSLLFSSAPVGVAVCALVCMVFLLGQLFADE
ncbi:hypothetical protein Q3G72_003236 [Acer saccharum]|nr:hypothetical protein Q3G72_003236 [Acer saccharum]